MSDQIKKIAAAGAKDFCLAFKSVGADEFVADTPHQLVKILNQICALSKYAIVFVDEDTAAQIADTLVKLKSNPLPAICLIPSLAKTNDGFALAQLKKDVEKAIGS